MAKLTLVGATGSITVLREGTELCPTQGELLKLTGLDALDARTSEPAALKHVWLGTVTIPRSTLITMWKLADQLSPEQNKLIADTRSAATTPRRRSLRMRCRLRIGRFGRRCGRRRRPSGRHGYG